MRGTLIALDHVEGREVAAFVRDGRLDDLLVEVEGAPLLPGTILRAVADRPLKGLGAMLVRLPGGTSGFLREPARLRPGQTTLVQVTSCAEPEKAVPVTTRLLFKSRFVIVTPTAPGINVSRRITDDERRHALLALAGQKSDAGQETDAQTGAGLIVRSSAADAADDEIRDDIRVTLELARTVTARAPGREPELLLAGPGPHACAWRDWPAPDTHDGKAGSFARQGIDAMLDPLRTPAVPLGPAAHAFIEPTRALVAIDVNTGADLSPAAGLKANLALARELPRQLRLRGLGGQITLDLAPMPKKERAAFEGHLRAAFRTDPVETALVGWTPLGHFELQRKRERLPLSPSDLP